MAKELLIWNPKDLERRVKMGEPELSKEDLVSISKFKEDLGEVEEEFDDGEEEELTNFIVHLVGGTRLRIPAAAYDDDDQMIDFFYELEEDGEGSEENVIASINKEFVICIHVEDSISELKENE